MSAHPGNAPLWTRTAAIAAIGATTGDPALRGGDWAASGVSIDSRTVQPGDLFIALRGPSHDGHDHVAAALAAGAVAAVVERVPDDVGAEACLLVTADTRGALVALGLAARARSRARVAAVTGSVGKTGTKEALALALAEQGRTFASQGNLNNDIGVPLSLARLPEDADFAIFELGTSHPGEIAPLSRMVRPHVGVITAVEAAHSANFPDVAAIADEKAGILAGMGAAGAAILPRDNPHFERLAEHARRCGVGRIIGFGAHAGARARLLECALHATSSAVTADLCGRAMRYSLGTPGRHWVLNSLAVLAAVKALDADPATAAAALARLRPLAGRGERRQVAVPGGTVLVIDESYNASPAAMRAALAVLGQTVPGPDESGRAGRRIAVLGDMLELGPAAPALHAELAEAVLAAGVELVFTCGNLMAALRDALPQDRRGGHAPDSAGLIPLLRAGLRPGDAVLVKGSLGSRMGIVVGALLAGGTGSGPLPGPHSDPQPGHGTPQADATASPFPATASGGH